MTLATISATQVGTDSDWAEILRQRVGGVRFGSVEITVEDSRIIQIELSVRSRLARRERDRKFRAS